MKKLYFAFALLSLFCSTTVVWGAKIHSTQTGTNTLNAATIKEKANAGDLYVALQNHTTTADAYINRLGYMSDTFDANGTTTWKVVPYGSGYALQNSDGNYISNQARPMAVSANIANATLFEPEDVNADVKNIREGFNSSMSVRWKVLPGKTIWINTNAASGTQTVIFNGGTGNWTCLFTYEVTLSDPDYTAMLREYVEPYLTTAYDDLFGLKAEAWETLRGEYETLTTACTEEAYEDFVARFNNLIANGGVHMPTSGYYRLRSALSGTDQYGYVGINNNSVLIGNLTAEAAASDPSTIFTVTSLGDNRYTLEVEGRYVGQATQSNNVPLSTTAVEALITMARPGVAQIKTGTGAYPYIHDSKNQNYRVVGWSAATNATASGWVFEPAEQLNLSLNVLGGESYASVYLPYPVTLDETKVADKLLNFYTLSIAGEEAVLKRASESVIPAGLGVVLISDEAATTVTVNVGGENTTTYANDLQGTYLPATVSGAYVLSAVEGEAGFYLLNGGTSLKANRAYLTLSSGVTGLRFVLDDSTVTGIDNVDATQRIAAPVYDLQGRRVVAPTTGIYIVGGQKIILK
ncbi:MAG: hypothetical protein IJ786_04665 [Bacteroidaceae bacterium]|nr:hypothetical protein [Bacteroidaceae bacterium]